MTRLDRAFIKAFETSDDGAHTVLISREPQRESRTASASAPVLAGPRAPHMMATAAAALGSRHHEPIASLSQFAPAARLDDTFRPLLEIDRLAWPEVCDRLLAAARAGWDTLAESLTGAIAADRKCVAITSVRRGAGRTTVALTIAKLMAARGMRPVVVDADFEHPALASACSVSSHIGWGEIIESALPLGEALILAIEDGVAIMPWHGAGGRLTAGHAADRASECFRTLHEHYDLVILDAPALVGPKATTEMKALMAATGECDIYLTRDARTMSDAALHEACSRLRASSLELAGTIDNFSTPTSAGP